MPCKAMAHKESFFFDIVLRGSYHHKLTNYIYMLLHCISTFYENLYLYTILLYIYIYIYGIYYIYIQTSRVQRHASRCCLCHPHPTLELSTIIVQLRIVANRSDKQIWLFHEEWMTSHSIQV